MVARDVVRTGMTIDRLAKFWPPDEKLDGKALPHTESLYERFTCLDRALARSLMVVVSPSCPSKVKR